MNVECSSDVLATRDRKSALEKAIVRRRSVRWRLRLWGRVVKSRDGYRCICCGGTERVQAHHIIRKILLPDGAFDPGNGITLCNACHRRVHADFNQKPDRSLPMGAEQGDDQNEWSFLFGILMDDAISRGLPQNEFYYISDAVLDFSVSYQGYVELREAVEAGEISRLRFMHEIWRAMPERFYEDLVTGIILPNLES
jgi:hypothetical protein